MLGVGYDFGRAKAGLTYDRSELRDLTAAATTAPELAGVGSAQRSLWVLPVTVPLGTGQLIGTFARASDVKLGVRGTAANTGAKLFSLGYSYPLSKRTRWASCIPDWTMARPASTACTTPATSWSTTARRTSPPEPISRWSTPAFATCSE